MDKKEEKKLAREINKFSEENWKNEYKFYMNGEEIEVKFISLGMECDFKTQTNKYELEVETSGGDPAVDLLKIAKDVEKKFKEGKLPEPKDFYLGEKGFVEFKPKTEPEKDYVARLEEGQATTETDPTKGKQWVRYEVVNELLATQYKRLIGGFIGKIKNVEQVLGFKTAKDLLRRIRIEYEEMIE